MSRDLAQGVDITPVRTPHPAVRAVIALGANLGERAQTLAAAIDELSRLPLTTLEAVAEPRDTVALTLTGLDPSAPAYLNTVAIVSTRLAPTVLLDMMHAIEARHGRSRVPGEPRWQDRTLDLDLITYGDVRSDDPALTLPHPRAHERDFVLAPWVSIDADAVLPGRGRIDALLAALPEEASA